MCNWQVLVEDAARLQALYPGTNAAHIAQQQAIVVASWGALQERSANRREMLQASCDLQRFLAQVCQFLLNQDLITVISRRVISIRRISVFFLNKNYFKMQHVYNFIFTRCAIKILILV